MMQDMQSCTNDETMSTIMPAYKKTSSAINKIVLNIQELPRILIISHSKISRHILISKQN